MNILQLEILQSCQSHISSLEKMLPLKQLQTKIEELDSKIASPSLWSNPQAAAKFIKERKKNADICDLISRAKADVVFYQEYLSLESLDDQTFAKILNWNSQLQSVLFEQMMTDPADKMPAILSISAGAGGQEAANFVSILLRMYCRYAKNKNFTMEILDQKDSEEYSATCIDNVSIRVDGPYAYGFLKSQAGVIRLIRNSPFNADNLRQTSFAAISVSPDIEDIIDIKIEDKDIEITALTRGGSGGQNQNKVSSCCRIKHLPTNISVLVRTERDFHTNKKTALKMLKAKLYDIELKKKQSESDKKIAAQSDVAFGNQILTITCSPYSLVKDHRTGYEVNDAESVLDGNIDGFINAFLTTTK